MRSVGTREGKAKFTPPTEDGEERPSRTSSPHIRSGAGSRRVPARPPLWNRGRILRRPGSNTRGG